MTYGTSLHIGLNEVDSKHYIDNNGNPWNGRLFACENDAHDLAALASSLGYQVREPLLTKAATSKAVIDAIDAIAKRLEPGDTLLLTYSGHGGQVSNTNPDDDPEDDELDETWCLYDRQLLDDELFALFSQFRPGVRIVVLSDSCHSGTVTRNAESTGSQDALVKQLPVGVAIETERRNTELYASLQSSVPSKRLTSMAATVVLISGCQDHQFSRDGRVNGAFTEALLKAWQSPSARRSLPALHRKIVANIPPEFDQTPNLSVLSFDIGPALTI